MSNKEKLYQDTNYTYLVRLHKHSHGFVKINQNDISPPFLVDNNSDCSLCKLQQKDVLFFTYHIRRTFLVKVNLTLVLKDSKIDIPFNELEK